MAVVPVTDEDRVTTTRSHVVRERLNRVTEQLTPVLHRSEPVREWLASKGALLTYHAPVPSRQVQFTGLMDAAKSWSIPAIPIYTGQEELFGHALSYERLIIITTDELLPKLMPLTRRRPCKIVVLSRYVDDCPPLMKDNLVPPNFIEAMSEYREAVSLVLSEWTPDGNRRFCGSYVTKLGLPIMSFAWGVNLLRHVDVSVPKIADVVFLGSYFEKQRHIDRYFAPILARHSHTIIGPGWSESPYGLRDTVLEDFNSTAPRIYSGHTISLNVHHPHEYEGYTCNERVFNSVVMGGFPINDPVPRVREFFPEDEMIVAESPEDYIEKTDHFIRYPDERLPYIEKAQRRIFAEHTYHHRLADLLHFILAGSSLSSYCPVLNESNY